MMRDKDITFEIHNLILLHKNLPQRIGSKQIVEILQYRSCYLYSKYPPDFNSWGKSYPIYGAGDPYKAERSSPDQPGSVVAVRITEAQKNRSTAAVYFEDDGARPYLESFTY